MIFNLFKNLKNNDPGNNNDPGGKKAKRAAPPTKNGEAPRPLTRPSEPPAPFPTNSLGSMLGDAAHGIAHAIQVPEAMAGTSVLAAAALAVQPHADIKLPYGAVRPISLYAVEVSESGDRKTSADNLATVAVKRRQSQLLSRYEHESRSTKEDGGEAATIRQEPTYLIKEPTAEGIYRAAQRGQPSLGLFTSEGGAFVGGHGFTPETKLRTMTMLCDFWDGEALSRTRGGEPASILEGRRLSAHLMMQPGIAATLLSDPQMKDQGLLSRLLVTAPVSLMGTRQYRDPDSEQIAAIDRYNDHLSTILDVPMPYVPDRVGVLAPKVLPQSAEAKSAWIKFHDDVEGRLGSHGSLSPISGFAAKLPEQVARIAGVLALCDDLEAGEIEGCHVEAAVELARHYGREALRIFSVPAVNPDLVLAEELGVWLLSRSSGRLVPTTDIYQKGPKSIRNAAKARKIIAILEEHGWVSRKPGQTKIDGVTRSEVWYVVPQ